MEYFARWIYPKSVLYDEAKPKSGPKPHYSNTLALAAGRGYTQKNVRPDRPLCISRPGKGDLRELRLDGKLCLRWLVPRHKIHHLALDAPARKF